MKAYYEYRITLSSDQGKHRVRTVANRVSRAVSTVLKVAHAPFCAIVKVEKLHLAYND